MPNNYLLSTVPFFTVVSRTNFSFCHPPKQTYGSNAPIPSLVCTVRAESEGHRFTNNILSTSKGEKTNKKFKFRGAQKSHKDKLLQMTNLLYFTVIS